MHYVASGRGRPALVFVHGFTCDHSDWRCQLAFFSKNHEVIACDLRGHGATPGRAHECSIEHYGADVAALLAQRDLSPAVLVGHSMGCRVVLEAARLDPARVAGVVFIDGSRTGSGDGQAAEQAARAAIEARGYPAYVEPMVRQMFLRPSAEADAALARALRLSPEVGVALWPRVVRWDAEGMEAALGALRAPAMAIQSTHLNQARKRVPLAAGQSTPWLELLKEKLKRVEIRVVPGVGHFTQLEAPDVVNRLTGELLQMT